MTPQALEQLRADPRLGPLVDEHGELPIGPAEDPFKRLTVSIINQQLSVTSATAIRERVFDRFEITPESILAADPEALRETGLSNAKIEYMKNIAEVHLEKDLGVAYFQSMNNEEVIDELTQIKGVGTWTAKMYLIFCLGREDVFPVEDLGIRRGMVDLFGRDMDRTEMVEASQNWIPYRSYASRYIWRYTES